MVNKKLLDVAKSILAKNESGCLTGSLALQLQGLRLRREPHDIDIFLPYDSPSFEVIDGMTPYRREGEDEYDNDYYSRDSYRIKRADDDFLGDDIFVDVLRAINSNHPNLKTEVTGGIEYVTFDEIIKFKAHHALSGTHSNKHKHKDDLILILVANDRV